MSEINFELVFYSKFIKILVVNELDILNIEYSSNQLRKDRVPDSTTRGVKRK